MKKTIVSPTLPVSDSQQVGSIKAWLAAIRPRSLPVAIGPVIVGASFGYLRAGAVNLIAALLALAAALLMQIISNLQNDVGYTVRGGESSGTRTGLPRATANGWLGVRQVRVAIVALSLVATAIGVALVALRGWPVLAIGTLSLIAALAYMGGPKPIAYTPFGEMTVFIFFGLVAVCGTDWLLTGGLGAPTVFAAIAVGSLAAAALAVNNHRDIAHDREVGRHTFAVTFGAPASSTLFGTLLFFPFCLLPLIGFMESSPALLLPVFLLPAVMRIRRDFASCVPGLAFNRILFRTFVMGLLFASLLSAGALLARIQAHA